MNESHQEAYILAGGKGSRLKNTGIDVLDNTPKVLIRINTPHGEITMLENTIIGLKESGIDNLNILTTYQNCGDLIQRTIESCLINVDLNFHQQDENLGTAGAVYKALESKKHETAIITPADTLFPFEHIPDALIAHLKSGLDTTWVVTSKPGEGAQNAGRILIDSESGVIKFAFENSSVEIDRGKLETYGLTAVTSVGVIFSNREKFQNNFINYLNTGTYPVCLYRDYIPWLLTNHELVGTYDIKQPAQDLGVLERLIRFGWNNDQSETQRNVGADSNNISPAFGSRI